MLSLEEIVNHSFITFCFMKAIQFITFYAEPTTLNHFYDRMSSTIGTFCMNNK